MCPAFITHALGIGQSSGLSSVFGDYLLVGGFHLTVWKARDNQTRARPDVMPDI